MLKTLIATAALAGSAGALQAQELTFRITLEPAEGETVERIVEIEGDQLTVAQVDEGNPIYEERTVEEADREAIRTLLRDRVAAMDFTSEATAEAPRYTVEIEWDGEARQVQVEEVYAEGSLPAALVDAQGQFYEQPLE